MFKERFITLDEVAYWLSNPNKGVKNEWGEDPDEWNAESIRKLIRLFNEKTILKLAIGKDIMYELNKCKEYLCDCCDTPSYSDRENCKCLCHKWDKKYGD